MSRDGEGRLATVSALLREAPDPRKSTGPLAEALGLLFAEVAAVGPGLEALLAGLEGCGAERILAIRADAPVEPVTWLSLVASPAAEVVLPAEPDPGRRLLLLARDAVLAKGSEVRAARNASVEVLLGSLTTGRAATLPSRAENTSG